MSRTILRISLGKAILCCAVAVSAAGAVDRVTIAAGKLEGVGMQAAGVREFRGVPYAAAPIGPLRWAAPQPMQRWAGVRQARQFGPRCMQQAVFSDMVFRSAGISEDCLYLNIWTAAKSPRERLPVLVYFYGGGFIAGDGSELRYDGTSLASAGLVVVTVNYRLGVFGFMAHPGLSRESHGHGSGNYGLLDQHAALSWVHDNVAAFGGDPARVTIAGESAGSWSVSAQMVSPLSRGLISGAIGESGSLLGTQPADTLAQGERRGEQFANAAGARSIAALRAMPAAQLLELAGNPFQADGKSESMRFGATIDGYFFPRAPAELYAAGAQAHVPLLVGVNAGEGQPENVLGKSAPTVAAYRAALARAYGADAEAFFAAYPASADGEGVLDAAQDLASDLFISYSTRRWLELATRTGGRPTYFYQFSRARPAMTASSEAAAVAANLAAGGEATLERPRRATHSAEIEYALGNLDTNLVYAWTAEDRRVSKTMRAYFINFVKHGNPNGDGLPQWPQFSSGQRLTIDVVTRAEAENSAARQALFDRYFATHTASD
jgi:para-nitrobenzyl esterase